MESYKSKYTGLRIDELLDKIKNIPTNISQLTNDSNYQTAEQVDNRFQQLIGAAPADLDTLEEIAGKLQDGDDIHTALVQSISEKLPKSGGTIDGKLKVDCIETVNGNGLLFYHRSEQAGVTNEQYGIGTLDSQGVIRSNNSDLLHVKPDGTKSKIWDEDNDGSGSGLDADLLDGKQGEWYQQNVTRFKKLKQASEDSHCDANVDGNSGGIITNYSSINNWDNAPKNMGFGTILTITSIGTPSLAGQFAWDIVHNNEKPTKNLWFKAGSSSNGWGTDNWKQIAFTNSTVDKSKCLINDVTKITNLNTPNLINRGITLDRYNADASNKPGNGDNANVVLNISAGNDFGNSKDYYSQITIRNRKDVYIRNVVGDSFGNWNQFAFTDSNVASANKLTTKQLTNEDLNDIKDSSFTNYWGNDSNTCLNKPAGVRSFNLTNYYISSCRTQVIIDTSGNIYKRAMSHLNEWSDWKRLLTEDDYQPIVFSKVTYPFNLMETGEIIELDNPVSDFQKFMNNKDINNVSFKFKDISVKPLYVKFNTDIKIIELHIYDITSKTICMYGMSINGDKIQFIKIL